MNKRKKSFDFDLNSTCFPIILISMKTRVVIYMKRKAVWNARELFLCLVCIIFVCYAHLNIFKWNLRDVKKVFIITD